MALLGCGVTTGYGSPVKGCPIRAGSTVGVWGMGAVGLAAVMGARDMGAKRIVAIDMNTDRLKAAKVFGATDLINPNELDESMPQFLTKKFEGGIDLAFEATGDAEAMSTKKCYGKTCILGLSSKEVPIPNGLLLQGRILMGNTVGGFKTRDDVPMLAEKYKDGALQLDEFIGWRCSLDQINGAWDKFQRGEGIRSMISVSNE